MAPAARQSSTSSTSRSGPQAQPFTLRPFELLARASLLLGTLAGFGVGVLLLLPVAFRIPLDLPWLPLAQVHGQVQTLGFAGLFIFAVGTVLFPRFLGALRWDVGRARLGGLLLASGVLLRAVSQPLDPSGPRAALLLVSGLLTLAGPLLFASALYGACRSSVQPFSLWQLGLGLGLGSLLAALVLNLWAVWWLASEGLGIVPIALNEAIVLLEVQGFIVGAIMGVSLKIFPQFLILRPSKTRALTWLVPAYGLGVGSSAVGWLAQLLWPEARALSTVSRASGSLLALAALAGFVIALRLYEPAARPSGRPQITNPTRAWFRLAYAWLLGASAILAWLSAREAFGGLPASFTELSAARHAVTMGFLMVILVGMAARILPGYSGWATPRPGFLNLMIGLLLSGALLRVGGELSGGYGGLAGPITGLGGLVGAAGFLLFAATLWPALGHLPNPDAAARGAP